MGALVTRRRRTSQPQQLPQVDQRWLARGLKFAILPNVGFVNLADGSAPLQTSGPIAVNATDSSIAHAGARAEFAQISTSAGLTIISIWRSRAGSDYLGADGSAALVSNRTSSNTGWTYGRNGALGGGATGNVTYQSLTFQGVAQYTEANPTIESRVDTPVACRYDPTTGKISWFRFGQKSSSDTSAGAPSAGGNLVFGAQGDFSGNNSPWLDRDTVCLVFNQPLTDAEIADLTVSTSAPWQVFKAPARRLWLGSSSSSSNSGTFASTLSGAGLVASGQVVDSGVFASTLAGATLAASGLVASPPSGALASTLTGASMAAAGTVTNPGALASTLSGVTMSAAGTVTNRGAVASQLDGAAMSASGSVITIPTGSLASTFDGAALAAGGYVGTPPVGPDFFIRLPKNPRHVLHHH